MVEWENRGKCSQSHIACEKEFPVFSQNVVLIAAKEEKNKLQQIVANYFF